jgi:hypothetical protein
LVLTAWNIALYLAKKEVRREKEYIQMDKNHGLTVFLIYWTSN